MYERPVCLILMQAMSPSPPCCRLGKVCGIGTDAFPPPPTMESRKFGWRLALSDADLCAAYNLRYEVFVDEQGFGADRDLDR